MSFTVSTWLASVTLRSRSLETYVDLRTSVNVSYLCCTLWDGPGMSLKGVPQGKSSVQPTSLSYIIARYRFQTATKFYPACRPSYIAVRDHNREFCLASGVLFQPNYLLSDQ